MYDDQKVKNRPEFNSPKGWEPCLFENVITFYKL